jgi:ABC-type lipoprotein release transport system permease subunit
VALVAVLVLVICTLAAVIPARQAAKLDPVRALRYE